MRRQLSVLCFIAVIACAPAFAAEEKEGWYVGIEGTAVQAGHSDVTLAVPEISGYPNGQAITLDTGGGTAIRGLFGYRNNGSDYQVSFWSYDEDDNLSMSGDFVSALALPDLSNGFSSQIDAQGSLETTIIDLTWTRDIARNERSAFTWTLGLRSWETERETGVIYDMATPGSDLRVALQNEASGVGLLAGIGARYDFNDRWYGSTNVRMGYLTGTAEAQTAGNEFGTIYNPSIDEDRNFLTTDLDTRINVNVTDGLVLFLGYQYKQVDSALERLFFVDDVQEGAVTNDVQDLSFSGLTFGGSFTF